MLHDSVVCAYVICDCVGVSVHLSSREKKYKAGGKKKCAVTSIQHHVSFHTHAETIALPNMSCTGLLSPMSLQMPNGLLMLALVA